MKKKIFEWVFPSLIFLLVAVLEGQGFWLGGIGLIVWLFYKSVKDVI